jgi:hypothetical protein
MHIEKSRIRNVGNYVDHLPDGTQIKIAASLDAAGLKKLIRLGFSPTPQHGDTILPKPAGSVSRFNSEGKFIIHRHLPKEPRYIRTIHWSWKEWHGKDYIEREDFKDIYKDCYPRDSIDPPSEELTYVDQPHPAVASRTLIKSKETAEQVMHVINLFLEFFGQCDLVDIALAKLPNPKAKKANWQFLPPGKHPWTTLQGHLAGKLGRVSDSTLKVILDRHHTIINHAPTEIVTGVGGFYDYMAYVFEDHDIVVLDSIRYGNAVYVLGSDWEAASQLTKAEIINGQLAVARIIHSQGWKTELGRLLQKRSPNAGAVA